MLLSLKHQRLQFSLGLKLSFKEISVLCQLQKKDNFLHFFFCCYGYIYGYRSISFFFFSFLSTYMGWWWSLDSLLCFFSTEHWAQGFIHTGQVFCHEISSLNLFIFIFPTPFKNSFFQGRGSPSLLSSWHYMLSPPHLACHILRYQQGLSSI